MAAALLALSLAACSPAPCPWPGFRCAIGGPAETAAVVPTTTVPNPFACPGPAPSPAPPAPRGEPSRP